MLKLTVFPQGFTEPSGSPFSVKAMAFVAASGQPYEFNRQMDPRKAPKGKFPVLEHDGKTIPDSEQIRGYLEKTFDLDFDAGLSLEARAQSRAIIRMVDEHIYFGLLASRWQIDENWAITRKAFFGALPLPVRMILPGLVRKGTLKQVTGQGLGRHSVQEQVRRIEEDIASIGTLLGDQPFLFGQTPTGADYSAVPMLRALMDFPIETPLGTAVKNNGTICAYLERGKNALYPNP